MNNIKIAIICLAVLTVLFGVISVATNNWLKGCIDLRSFLGLHISVLDPDDELAMAYVSVVNKLNDSGIVCFASGLFNIEIDSTGFTETMGHNNEERTLHATAALMIIGLIVHIVGTLLTNLGSHQDPAGSKGRSLFVAGTVVFSLSMMCLFVGMLVYTVLFVDAKHGSPMLFFDQFQHGIITIGIRSKRNEPFPGTIDEEAFYKELTKIEQDSVVDFAYSIYLGWTSFFVSFLNLCTAVYACVRRKRENASHMVMT